MRLSGRVLYNLDTCILGLLDLLHRHLWVSLGGWTRLATERHSCHYRSGALASPRNRRVLAVQGILKVAGREHSSSYGVTGLSSNHFRARSCTRDKSAGAR